MNSKTPEHFGKTLHLVEDDESAQAAKHQQRLGKARQVGVVLEIEPVHRPFRAAATCFASVVFPT